MGRRLNTAVPFLPVPFVAVFLLLTLLCAASPDDAVRAFQEGRMADAERILRASTASAPNDPAALGLLAVVLDSQKKFDEAEKIYLRAIKLSPQSPALLNNLGNHYVQTAKPADARRSFERVLAMQPSHPNANLQLAKLAAVSGKSPDPYLSKIPDGPEKLAVRAEAMAASGKPEAGIALTGGDPRILFAAAMGLVEARKFEPAEQFFAAALEKAPDNFDILYNLAMAATHAGHLERAVEVYQAALKQKPDDADTLYNLAGVYAQKQDLRNAILALGAARRSAPQRTDIIEALAQAFDSAGYHSDAALAWSEYLKVRPDADFARRERGFAWARAGDKNQALPDLASYVQKHPEDYLGHFQYAVALTVSDKAKAVSELNRAIALKPDFVLGLHTRGALLLQEGKPEDALADLERVVKLEPDNARALDYLGQVYRELNRPGDAERVLRRAVELNPNDGPTLMHLGHALRDAGKDDEAVAYLERFQKLGTIQKIAKPRSGLLDFLSLSPAEQKARYLDNARQAVEAAPKDGEMRVRFAVALLDAGREDEAKREFRQALALEPPPGLLASAGSALLQAQHYELAKAYLEQAVAGQPEARLDLAIATFHTSGAKAGLAELDKLRGAERNGDYWLARAQMLEAAGQFEDAVETLNRGFQAEPTRPDLYYEASLLLIQHDRITEAVRLLEQATHKLPDDPELALQQAIVLELAAQSDEAGKKLSAIERRWPEWDRPWLIHGIITASHWKPADARKRIENAVALGSDEPQTWFYLAEAILNSGGEDVARAQQAAQRALELAPDDPYVQTLAGRVELAQGNVEGAIGHLHRAVELLPTLAEAHVQLSRALVQAGRAEEAAKEGEIVRRLSEEQSAAAPSPSVKKDLFRLKGK